MLTKDEVKQIWAWWTTCQDTDGWGDVGALCISHKALREQNEELRGLLERALSSVNFELGHWQEQLKEAQAYNDGEASSLYYKYMRGLEILKVAIRAALGEGEYASNNSED